MNSPCHAEFTSGTCFSAIAAALVIKSPTLSFAALAFSASPPALSAAARLNSSRSCDTLSISTSIDT